MLKPGDGRAAGSCEAGMSMQEEDFLQKGLWAGGQHMEPLDLQCTSQQVVTSGQKSTQHRRDCSKG